MIIGLILAIETESDKEFMQDLYNKYYPLMYSMAYKIVLDHHVVEDLLHDAFVRLINNLQKIRSLDCYILRSYLVFTIRGVCFSYLSKASTRRETYWEEDEMDKIEGNTDFAEETVSAIDLSEAITRISQRDQELLNYKYLLGMSDSEIEKCLDIPAEQVRVYVSRAKKKALRAIQKGEENE